MTSTRNLARKIRRTYDVRTEHASSPERVIVYASPDRLATMPDEIEGRVVVKIASLDAGAFVGVQVKR